VTRPFSKETVLRHLGDLDRRDRRRRVFGASAHQYRLNPALPVAVIEAFEGRHGISLPVDYRLFLTEIGGGGAGPYNGVLPFGKDDDGRDWEGGGLVGDPGRPFPHTAAWNLPDSFWAGEPAWPPDTPVEEQDRLMEAWDRELERHYWHPAIMDGAIPICHKGCALRQWLVIHGEQRSFIWDDLRADQAGIAPVRDASGNPMTFAAWYMGWLDDTLGGRDDLPSPPAVSVPWWRRGWRTFRRGGWDGPTGGGQTAPDHPADRE
jgi:hypothetical protein